MKRKRVAIVGAGPGGLATAMLLAADGLEVDIYEQAPYVGGRTSVLSVDGYHFDRGPTFFLFPEILDAIFRRCGRSLWKEVELRRLEPNYRLQFEDGSRMHATTDPERMRAEIARLCPQDAEGLGRYLDENRAKFDLSRPFLERPFLRHRDLLGMPFGKLASIVRPWNCVDKDLKRYFSDPRVRLGFSFQSKYLGMSPFRCPALFTILAYLEYEYGIYHPVGGCGAVTQAMARVAREMGVRIHLSTPVRRLLMQGGRADGVITDDGAQRSDAVVINADFAHAMEHLVPNSARRKWTNEKLARKKYSCSTFMLYLGVEGEVPEVDHHTIFLADGYEEHLRDIETRYRLTANPSFYVQNPTLTDSSMAPEGHSALYVLVPVPHMHDNVDWDQAAPSFREQTLNQLQAKLGIPRLRERIRVEKMFTPADWQADMHLYRGATFSLAHSWDQMLSFRPRNQFEDIDGVFLTGGGTHPGSGLPVIFQSAQITSELIAKALVSTYPATSRRPAVATTGI